MRLGKIMPAQRDAVPSSLTSQALQAAPIVAGDRFPKGPVAARPERRGARRGDEPDRGRHVRRGHARLQLTIPLLSDTLLLRVRRAA